MSNWLSPLMDKQFTPQSTIPRRKACSVSIRAAMAGFLEPTHEHTEFLGQQGWYNHTIIVDPSNPQRVYAAGVGQYTNTQLNLNNVIRSDNGGVTWVDISGDSNGNGPHVDCHAFAFTANGTLIIGNDGGVWSTSNRGGTWVNLNTNLSITQFTGIAVDPNDPNKIWGGTQDNGTNRTVGSTTWQHMVDGDGGQTRIDPTNPNIIYHTFYYARNAAGFIRRSTDGGKHVDVDHQWHQFERQRDVLSALCS